MTTLDLRLAPRDQNGRLLVGQGRSSRDPIGHVTFQRPPSIQERIYEAVRCGGGAVSRGQIAKALGLRKTPWLHDRIEGLVHDGLLARHSGQWKNGVVMYLYTAPVIGDR